MVLPLFMEVVDAVAVNGSNGGDFLFQASRGFFLTDSVRSFKGKSGHERKLGIGDYGLGIGPLAVS